MDATRLTNLKSEVNALATFLSNYDTSVADFLSGSNSTCIHFADVIPNLSNDNSAALAYEAVASGQGSSYGALVDFVYGVAAVQRNTAIILITKAAYYTSNDNQILIDDSFNTGEGARTLSYIIGNSPDMGITI